MAQVHGDLGNGKFGALGEARIQVWLLSKLSFRTIPKFNSNMQSCINDVLSSKGKATGGRTYDGEPVLHTSAGKSGQKYGCTLFYVIRGNHVAKIIGIGSHTSSSSYEIYWKTGRWLTGKSLSF